MYVEAFANRTFFSKRIQTFLPDEAAYDRNDTLELCYVAERPDLVGLCREDVAQSVFGTLNHDSRPNPFLHSLSIGDVVSCRDGAAEWSLSVEVMGFCPVDPPIFASDDEHAVYREKVGD